MTASSSRARRSMRHLLLTGGLVTLLLVLGVGVWAAMVEISGAIVTAGSVVVDSSVKRVQHPTGGIVSELRVRDGQLVANGDILAQLDATVPQASLAMVSDAISELTVRRARLLAEQAFAEGVDYPPTLDRADPRLANIMAGEADLMETRRIAREGQKAQLSEQILQSEQEVVGNEAQLAALGRLLVSYRAELENVAALREENLVTAARVAEIERRLAELEGSQGQMIATSAMIRGRISQTRLEIAQIDDVLQSEVTKELREIDAQLSELEQRRVTALDQLQRVTIRAPQAGFIHQLAVHTVGGVVAPGETLMLVVPDNDDLIIEARVSPQDIDQLTIGQEAMVRLSSFSLRTTPDLHGEITQISADRISDGQSGQTYYLSRIRLADTELAKLGELELLPGMPTEVFIKTQDRSILTYLTQPMADQVARAFREE